MEWRETGIVLGVRRHGETDVILEVMTAGRGRHFGLVKGGRSRRLRPVVQPGNTLGLTWRARLDEHLGNFRVEPVTERSVEMIATPVAAFGLALAAAHLRLLPERDPHPRLYEALLWLLDHLDPPELGGELMARFELLLLDELGFGLDLDSCAATGSREELAFVSPKSGRAVSRAAGLPYAERLLPLPPFLHAASGTAVDPGHIEHAFSLTRFFLDRYVLEPRGVAMSDSRESFLRAIRPAGGLAPVSPYASGDGR